MFALSLLCLLNHICALDKYTACGCASIVKQTEKNSGFHGYDNKLELTLGILKYYIIFDYGKIAFILVQEVLISDKRLSLFFMFFVGYDTGNAS